MGVLVGGCACCGSRAAVERLERALAVNPYHPFVRVGHARFVYRAPFRRFVVALCVLCAAAIAIVLLSVLGLVNELYYVLLWFAAIGAAFAVWAFHRVRVYVIDHEAGSYSFFLRGVRPSPPVVRGPLRNIYVRLLRARASGHSEYFVVLGGYRIDKIVLSGTSHMREQLRALARRLASNLQLNYFDEDNYSDGHLVRWRKRGT